MATRSDSHREHEPELEYSSSSFDEGQEEISEKGVEPYRYEPYTSEESALEEEREETERDVGNRLNNTEWCLCAQCQVMPTAEESQCCHEISKTYDKITGFNEALLCKTDHPGFPTVCLDRYVHETAYYQYRQQYDQHMEDSNEIQESFSIRDSINSASSDIEDEESIASCTIGEELNSSAFNSSRRIKKDEHKTVFSANEDRFSSLDGVRAAIKAEGLESCRLIFVIDYTMSNLSQGKNTFGGMNLHNLNSLNPYQEVICILGEVLEPLNNDPDGAIPAFGFGDSITKDKSIFKLKPEEGECRGFMEVLEVYEQTTPKIQLGGPTNFAPLIDKAVEIVKHSGYMYHILVIVADGQVRKEKETRHSIETASDYPLSIIMIGVGDGPWDTMHEFDDQLPQRRFDNFQFVNFYEIMSTSKNPQAAFALSALMEIPDQYKAIKDMRLMKN